MKDHKNWGEFLDSFEEAFENLELKELDQLLGQAVDHYLGGSLGEKTLKEALELGENYIYLAFEAGLIHCQGLSRFFRLLLEKSYWQLDYVGDFIGRICQDLVQLLEAEDTSCLINYSLIYLLLDLERQDLPREALEKLNYRKLRGQELRDFFYLSLFYDLEKVDQEFFKGKLDQKSLELGQAYFKSKGSQDFAKLGQAFRRLDPKLDPRFLDRLKENILYRNNPRVNNLVYEINNQLENCPLDGKPLKEARRNIVYRRMGQVEGLLELDLLYCPSCQASFMTRKSLGELDLGQGLQIIRSGKYYDDLYDYKAKKIPEINLSDYD